MSKNDSDTPVDLVELSALAKRGLETGDPETAERAKDLALNSLVADRYLRSASRWNPARTKLLGGDTPAGVVTPRQVCQSVLEALRFKYWVVLGNHQPGVIKTVIVDAENDDEAENRAREKAALLGLTGPTRLLECEKLVRGPFA